jgi:hypothetical protein
MTQRDETDSAGTVERSEFGAGIVVCLAKFSEHLQQHGAYSERTIREYAAASPEKIAAWQEEARSYPRGDAAQRLASFFIFEVGNQSREGAISHAIAMWMNSASDHMYDLDDRAPAPLKELAALTLRIGHGFTDETWTVETMDRIRDLWRESCLEVDRILGVDPDWGEW